MLLPCAFLLLTLATSVSADKPGFKARITGHALQYASQQAMAALTSSIPGTTIPNQSGSSGHLSYSLTNIKIKGFEKPGSNIRMVPGTGLTWSLVNLGIQLHADWRVKFKQGWFKISDSGSLDVSATGISVTATMALGADSSGRPTIHSGKCQCGVGSVHIDFHGHITAAILNLFKGQIEGKVRGFLPGKVCDLVKQQIDNNAQKSLAKLKVLAYLMDNKFRLDYRLVAAPVFQTAYMETLHKGEITWNKDPRSPPFSPSPLPQSSSSSNMLYLWIGDYVPQSFLYAAQNHGFLQYNLTDKDLPAAQKGFLKTTCTTAACIGNLIPVLGKKYPNCTVEMRMNSTSLPKVLISPGTLGARLTGDIALYAITPTNQRPYLLTLSVSAIFNMTASIMNQQVVGNVTGFRSKVQVLKSAVGTVKSRVINHVVRFVMNFFVIPEMNEVGNRGFPLLVTDDIKFVNSQLQIQENAVMIATDLVYQPHF